MWTSIRPDTMIDLSEAKAAASDRHLIGATDPILMISAVRNGGLAQARSQSIPEGVGPSQVRAGPKQRSQSGYP